MATMSFNFDNYFMAYPYNKHLLAIYNKIHIPFNAESCKFLQLFETVNPLWAEASFSFSVKI